ncbi:MAG: hypothetical protein OXG90_09045 [Gammaproteobacteria bacterium]|nr:hypothetical protein [Gammaproteobacteria bacterium]
MLEKHEFFVLKIDLSFNHVWQFMCIAAICQYLGQQPIVRDMRIAVERVPANLAAG